MRIKDFTIGKLKAKSHMAVATTCILALLQGSTLQLWKSFSDLTKANAEVKRSLQRSRRIRQLKFNLNAWTDEGSLTDFRFLRSDVGLVSRILDFPRGMAQTERSRYKASALEATAILLRRLSSPIRWHDLETVFGRSKSALSEIFLVALAHAHEKLGSNLNHFESGLVASRANLHAAKIHEKGAPLSNCVGFIDGAEVRIARPTRGQKSCYSGHKRAHVLKCQTVVRPDGLFLSAFCPLEGRRHDMTLYRASNMDQVLSQSLVINDTQHCIYGDPAYVFRPHLQIGFKGSYLTAEQMEYSAAMSSAREAVEWVYKDAKQFFTANDYSRALKALKTPVGLYFHVSLILANMRCCLHGSQTSKNFFAIPQL